GVAQVLADYEFPQEIGADVVGARIAVVEAGRAGRRRPQTEAGVARVVHGARVQVGALPTRLRLADADSGHAGVADGAVPAVVAWVRVRRPDAHAVGVAGVRRAGVRVGGARRPGLHRCAGAGGAHAELVRRAVVAVVAR